MEKEASEVLRLENPVRSGKGHKGGFDKGPETGTSCNHWSLAQCHSQVKNGIDFTLKANSLTQQSLARYWLSLALKLQGHLQMFFLCDVQNVSRQIPPTIALCSTSNISQLVKGKLQP